MKHWHIRAALILFTAAAACIVAAAATGAAAGVVLTGIGLLCGLLAGVHISDALHSAYLESLRREAMKRHAPNIKMRQECFTSNLTANSYGDH
jgi:hypothetical protein